MPVFSVEKGIDNDADTNIDDNPVLKDSKPNQKSDAKIDAKIEAKKEQEPESKLEIIEEELDHSNQFVATKWDQLNRTVDMFFTNQSSPRKNKSSIFVYATFSKTEGEDFTKDYDFQLKFDLPNTTKNLKIVIERQQDEISNALTDTSAPTAKAGSRNQQNQKVSESHYTAGANYLLSQSKKFTSFLHFGIRLDMPLNPNVKLDLQRDWKAKYINTSLLQKTIYYRQEGLQSVTQAAFNRKWNNTFQTDQINSLVWTQETGYFVLRNSFVLYQDLGNEKGLSYSVGANANFDPTYAYDSYDASVSYRQLLYNEWLYGTFTTGVGFSKVYDWHDIKFVSLRLDIFFNEK